MSCRISRRSWPGHRKALVAHSDSLVPSWPPVLLVTPAACLGEQGKVVVVVVVMVVVVMMVAVVVAMMVFKLSLKKGIDKSFNDNVMISI
ncbi:hypothetical protein E2C01_065880 [Portunus trituberculatus]|uniref:Uncharacterized protein n=1 Tax=Portunus trituberculatus TaxID=210409 RepID=A0A5B7HSE2_PORTR|nr:hypothetical protein [Portunus trituberculatus]